MTHYQHPQSQDGSDTPPNFRSQKQHMLDVLIAAGGAEVPLANIMVCAAQYTRCIHQLRRSGHKIINRKETRNGVCYSWYRLESSPEELTRVEPASTRPQRSRKKSAGLDPSSTPQSQPPSPAQTLSLFPEMATPATSPQRPAWRDPELGGVKNGSVKHG